MKNEKSKKNDPLPKNMHYLTIDSKNKLSEENDDILNQRITDLANSTIVENVGNEINKFFIKILPENKEADLLKFNYSLSSKIIKAFGLNNIMLKQKCEEYISDIINMKIEPNSPFSLTSEINEKLSLILSVIYRTIKKEGKLFSIDDINNWVIKEYEENKGILDILQKSSNNDLNATYSYMCSPNIYTDLNDGSDLGKSSLSPFMANKINLEPLRITQVVQSRKTTAFLNLNESKKMNSIQNKNANKIPLELFILREKFENIKTVKLPLKKHNAIYNELIPLEQNDIIFSIFVLSNLKLLFQRFFGIELDLSNEIILKDELADINNYYEKILKENKRSRKMTYYKSENKKRVYDVYKNKSYNQNNKSAEEIESSDNFSMFSIREINIDETKKNQERFINKHIYSLHMIIIYWYFITKLSELKYFNLTIPINYEDKILLMLKESKISFFEFNIFNNMSDKLAEVTIDFNSLENKLFQQIVSFLFVNPQLTKCNLCLFPPEEYFEPRHLFNLLNQYSKSKFNKSEINPGEEIDVFILRKMSEYFEANINKLFCYFHQMQKLNEISLIFEIPSIMNKVSNYEIIILKLILNIFTLINSRDSFKKITVLSDNLNFDNRKHPFLSEFLDDLDLHNNKNSKIESLTLKLRIYEIYNLYRIIPYNVNHLYLGAFDLVSFQYFVEYITSSEFSVHSKIQFLQITLSNTIITLDEQCYNALKKLLIYYPKNLEEICINTSIYANREQIENLIKNTNYNKIAKITFSLNLNNNDENKMFSTPKKNELNSEKSKENEINLYYIKKDEIYEEFKNSILNMMYKVGNKYNKDFMDFNIFSGLEKFLCNNGKKKIIIQ
jgi:hypothetical protein